MEYQLTTSKKKSKNPYYVDNEKLYQEISSFQAKRNQAIAEGKTPPQPNKYLGDCISLIATGIASKPSFRNYPHIEDMIGDAVENCSKALYVFNPEKTRNPFGYLTQTVYNAFYRRIDMEKHELAVRHRYAVKMAVFDEHFEQGADGEEHVVSILDSTSSYMSDNAAAVEKKRQEARNKRKEAKAKKEVV